MVTDETNLAGAISKGIPEKNFSQILTFSYSFLNTDQNYIRKCYIQWRC